MDENYKIAEQFIQQAKDFNLVELDLSALKLTKLPGAIDQLTQLEMLNLSGNWLTVVPTSIGQLTLLNRLDLSYNSLKELPGIITQLTQLRQLNLSCNPLAELPEVIGELTLLEILDLSRIQLTKLPDSISQLTQLKVLNLYDNQLTKLPDSIGQLTQLKRLHLSRNKLTKLPDSIDQLTQLEDLELYNNQLTILPDSIGQLTQLKSLHLSNNLLTQLPKSINKIKRLTLYLLGNPQIPARLLIQELPSALRYLQRRQTKNPWELTVGLENQFLNPPKKSITGLFETVACTFIAGLLIATDTNILWWSIWASLGLLFLLRSEPSTELGLNWFGKVMKVLHIKDSEYNKLHSTSYSLRLILACALSLGVRAFTTLAITTRHPIITLLSIPENLRNQTLYIDITTPPELIPGSESHFSENPTAVLVNSDLTRDVSKSDDEIVRKYSLYQGPFHISLLLRAFFAIAWCYRWLIKSTALIYWPLYFIDRFNDDDNNHTKIKTIALDYDKDILRIFIGTLLLVISTSIVTQWFSLTHTTLQIENNYPVAHALMRDFNPSQFVINYTPWFGTTLLHIGFFLLTVTLLLNTLYLSGKVTKQWEIAKKQNDYIKVFKTSLTLQYISACILLWYGFEYISRVGVNKLQTLLT